MRDRLGWLRSTREWRRTTAGMLSKNQNIHRPVLLPPSPRCLFTCLMGDWGRVQGSICKRAFWCAAGLLTAHQGCFSCTTKRDRHVGWAASHMSKNRRHARIELRELPIHHAFTPYVDARYVRLNPQQMLADSGDYRLSSGGGGLQSNPGGILRLATRTPSPPSGPLVLHLVQLPCVHEENALVGAQSPAVLQPGSAHHVDRSQGTVRAAALPSRTHRCHQ